MLVDIDNFEIKKNEETKVFKLLLHVYTRRCVQWPHPLLLLWEHVTRMTSSSLCSGCMVLKDDNHCMF